MGLSNIQCFSLKLHFLKNMSGFLCTWGFTNNYMREKIRINTKVAFQL